VREFAHLRDYYVLFEANERGGQMSDFEPLKGGSAELADVTEALAGLRDTDRRAHIVQFYERDDFLVGEVSRFIGTALGAGDSGIVIASKAHREGIAQRLASNSVNTALATAQGRYVALDAEETLAKFMIAGEPDPERFTTVLGEVIEGARKAVGREDARVVAFGEMVSVLWAEGKEQAAVRLEQLWNALAEAHSFSLRCAYPMIGFSHRDSTGPFLRICAEHSSVLPAESYMALIAEDERQRAVAHLQQQARAYESESALRQSEERFRLLIEGIRDYAIYSLDPQGFITSWNNGAYRIKGYSAQEIIGQNFSRFYTPEDLKQGLPAKVLQIARDEGHYAGEGWRVRKDGTRFWSSVVVTPLRNNTGEVIGFSKITRDMTDRKVLMDSIQQHAEELEKAQQSLRRLSGQLLQVQDDERRRLARELHDGAGQILAALNMNLESLHEAVKDKIAPSLARRLAESIRLANQVIKETRTLSYLLHPPLLDEAGLRDALQWFVGGFIERSGIQTELEISANFSRLPREFEIAIFRITQEALTNIHRHSGSAKASIRLVWHENEVLLTITDQGRGITPAAAIEEPKGNRKLGVGIVGMRERVLQLGGRFEISAGNPGTIIEAVFPISSASE
jgi:PAS domain S-box-containing protein